MAMCSITGYCWLSWAGAMVFGFCELTLALVAMGNLHLVVVAVQDCLQSHTEMAFVIPHLIT